jgi:hypothetical protein
MKTLFPLSTATTLDVTVLASFAAVLAITIWPNGPAGKEVHRVVRCPGPAYCAKLTRAAFAPVPRDVMCSQVYGGPQQALVVGTLEGRKVWARFKRTDGCQTARWDRLAFLFGA